MEPFASSPVLVIQQPSGGFSLPLERRGMWTIGRSRTNRIVLCDRRVSRTHAVLYCTALGEFYLLDLGSLNGSFVNSHRVTTPIALKHGDQLTLGTTQIEFCISYARETSVEQLDLKLKVQPSQVAASNGINPTETLPGLGRSLVDFPNLTVSQLIQVNASLHKTWMLQEQYAAGERDFSRMDLQAADLSYLDLRGINLSEANLRGAKLHYTQLQGANLQGANLSEALLWNTDLTGANLLGVNLIDTDLDWVVLTDAMLAQEILEEW